MRDRRKSVENYTGVGISVSFNSKDDEQQRIQQLSGGQKSMFISLSLSLSLALFSTYPLPSLSQYNLP